MDDPKARITESLAERRPLAVWLRKQTAVIADIVERIAACLAGGSAVYTCGNGGSASQADHMAAELSGRFKLERSALRAMPLATSGATATAIANDYGYDEVFARQLSGLARRGDVLLAFSTSGGSPNVLSAARTARGMGVEVIALTGQAGNVLESQADVALCVPDDDAARIQEVHLTVLHLVCEMVEARLFSVGAARPPERT